MRAGRRLGRIEWRIRSNELVTLSSRLQHKVACQRSSLTDVLTDDGTCAPITNVWSEQCMMSGDSLPFPADDAAMHCEFAERLPSEASCPLSDTSTRLHIVQSSSAAMHGHPSPRLQPCRGTHW